MDRTAHTGRDALAASSLVFLAANLLHGADHLRQGLSGVGSTVKVGGALITAAAVVVVVATVRRHPRAPLAAVWVGLAAAALVTASHLLPHWSVISDSYVDDTHVDALSWVVVIAEVGAAVVLGCVALHRLRNRARQPVGRTGATHA